MHHTDSQRYLDHIVVNYQELVTKLFVDIHVWKLSPTVHMLVHQYHQYHTYNLVGCNVSK